MERLEWSESFATGNANIDAEHKIFINLINKLITALESGRDESYLSRLTLEIQKYAEFHFISEENLMIDINYPALAEHQNYHLKLLEKFNITLNYIDLGRLSTGEFITFLIGWFTSHTVKEDLKFAAFLQKQTE